MRVPWIGFHEPQAGPGLWLCEAGMTFARYSIFFGTEKGKEMLKTVGVQGPFAGCVIQDGPPKPCSA